MKDSNHLFSFLSYFMLANEKYHYPLHFFSHFFIISLFSFHTTKHSIHVIVKKAPIIWMLLFLFSHVWLVREDSQVTTIALISISPSVTNYHTACSLIHVLDKAILLEAKKTGHLVFKKYPIIIHFFPLSFLLLFFDRPPLLFPQLFFFYVQNVFIIVLRW